MKKLALLSIVLTALVAGGCMDSRIGKVDAFATPAYSGKERGELIAKNMEMEWKMINDDIDSALLLRPMSSLTIWDVR